MLIFEYEEKIKRISLGPNNDIFVKLLINCF